MSLPWPKKIAIFGSGVLLGLVVLQFFPKQKEKPRHPWHEQTAPEGSFPRTVRDDLGREVLLERQPRHFISLAPSLTETLFAMGMGDHIKGVTQWDDYPEAAARLRDQGGNIGAIDTPNQELILALRPDLILATALTPRSVVEALHRPPATVVVSLSPASLDDILADIATLGRVTGVPSLALQLSQELRGRRDVARARIPAGAPTRRTILLYGISEDLKPGWTPGKGTWAGDLIVQANGDNVAAAIGESWGSVSMESLLGEDPEVILLVDGESAAEQAALRARVASLGAHPVWGRLQAVRAGRITYLPSGPMNIPGPRAFEAYERIVAALWP